MNYEIGENLINLFIVFVRRKRLLLHIIFNYNYYKAPIKLIPIIQAEYSNCAKLLNER